MIRIAIFLFVLCALSGLMSLVNVLQSRHASCCYITPPIQAELERLANEGVIDIDRAAASMELRAWSDPQSPAPNTEVEPRADYQSRVTWRLAAVVGEEPGREWTEAKVAASQSHLLIAAICLVACVVVAISAFRLPKVVVASAPKAVAECV
jgi:hypothetical protein